MSVPATAISIRLPCRGLITLRQVALLDELGRACGSHHPIVPASGKEVDATRPKPGWLAERRFDLGLVRDKAPERLGHITKVRKRGSHARVPPAATLVCALSAAEANVMVVLTARGITEKLQIHARCDREDYAAQLSRAGATKVILPARACAEQMVGPSPRLGDR